MKGSNQQPNPEYNTLSIVGFIFAFLFPPAGFVLGIIALSQIKKTNEKGRGLAIAAIVLGGIFFLFLILMVFVGISWIVIRNTVQSGDNTYGGNNQLDFNSMCLNTEIVATRVTNIGEDYTITLQRQSGEEEIGGVKLVFTNEIESSSSIVDVPGNIEALIDTTVLATVPSDALPDPDKVSVVVYFLDSSGNQQLCQTSNQFKFA